jgi:hypothetical protein
MLATGSEVISDPLGRCGSAFDRPETTQPIMPRLGARQMQIHRVRCRFKGVQ